MSSILVLGIFTFDSQEVDVRLRQLENQINSIAGETLLQWHITRDSTGVERRRLEFLLKMPGRLLLALVSFLRGSLKRLGCVRGRHIP